MLLAKWLNGRGSHLYTTASYHLDIPQPLDGKYNVVGILKITLVWQSNEVGLSNIYITPS